MLKMNIYWVEWMIFINRDDIKIAIIHSPHTHTHTHIYIYIYIYIYEPHINLLFNFQTYTLLWVDGIFALIYITDFSEVYIFV